MRRQGSLFNDHDELVDSKLLTPDQLFAEEDIPLLSQLVEDDRFDRKRATVDDNTLAKMLSSFGNGPNVSGGVVALGIEDNGDVSGCKHLSDTQLQRLEKFGDAKCPDGRFSTKRVRTRNVRGEEDFVILARIQYVTERLVQLTDGKAFQRIVDEDRKLTDTEREDVRINKGERRFGLEPCGLKYPEDFNEVALGKYCTTIRAQRDSELASDESILQAANLGRIEGGDFVANNACAILFAKQPLTLFPGSKVHFLQYRGTVAKSGKEFNVVKDRQFTGTIHEILKGLIPFMENTLRDFTNFERGTFTQVPEYPRDAWYELIVNALVHRSYNHRNAKIFVRMFDDHLEVESPGGFMPYITPETIYGNHRPRNPYLMDVLRESGEVRCISEGTIRVRNEMEDASLPAPSFEEKSSSGIAVLATIRNDIANRINALDSEAYKQLGDKVSSGLSADEQKIVNFIVENGSINVTQAQTVISFKDWSTAKRRLQSLMNRGVVRFESKGLKDPRSHYVLQENPAVRLKR